jgi:hypothetical protein
MKSLPLLLFCCLLIISPSYAQKPVSDSTANLTLKELNLTNEQKLSVKKLIWEYKVEDRKRRRALRHKIFLLLNVKQQTAIRRMWRRQLSIQQ